ncbi:hypothetical protein GGS23DRAFT_595514 [Durotheca rogersii]|uniref:uncharacterized protein n=1 Tax=Durotheca rogersii TaxID=419775 RepID=UPI002220EBC8|nr:uncharacterized protein GGS23DRAFT_595514 [Durotheca rogersii]KAI5864821.1 hypothetical protein GGS23DRAFT_595514 [Durotheca rogersii]
MNAHALLTSQGWRGTGHPLGTRGDGRGLTHRLLMRRNEDGRGLGSRQAEAERRADAWWLNAFDEALKGIDTGSGGATVKQAAGARGGALAAIATPAAKYTGSRGLYSSFVRGGVLEGTLGPQAKKEADAGGLPTPPDSDGGAAARRRPGGRTKARAGETKEERRARRAEKRSRKAEKRARKEGKAEARARNYASRHYSTDHIKAYPPPPVRIRRALGALRRLDRSARRPGSAGGTAHGLVFPTGNIDPQHQLDGHRGRIVALLGGLPMLLRAPAIARGVDEKLGNSHSRRVWV